MACGGGVPGVEGEVVGRCGGEGMGFGGRWRGHCSCGGYVGGFFEELCMCVCLVVGGDTISD